MANKRMFNMKIVDSDAFLDMPLSTQCLYFHLNMRADDDGFVGNPKRIMRIIGASDDDLKLLIAKRFLLIFESGVIVIKHWRMHNTLSKSRYHETTYIDEKSQLLLKKNNAYSFNDGNKIDDKKLISMFTNKKDEEQVENTDIGLDIGIDIGLDKDIDIDTNSSSKKPKKHKHGEYGHVLLSDKELEKLNEEYGIDRTQRAITYLDEAKEMKGYKYKSDYLAMRKWVFDAVDKHRPAQESNTNNPFIEMLQKGEY